LAIGRAPGGVPSALSVFLRACIIAAQKFQIMVLPAPTGAVLMGGAEKEK
jgi:hypothetical protein